MYHLHKVLCCTWRSGLMFILCGSLFSIGCSGDTNPSSASADPMSSSVSGPRIIATPNPVPAGDGKRGTTTISWDTGNGSVGEVYVSVNGAAERLVAGKRPKGSLDAPWIGKGEYEFRLYAGNERKTMLCSVKVTGSAK